jgi:hypothetical protein
MAPEAKIAVELLDVPDLVEGAVGEVGALIADGKAPIGIVEHLNPLADRVLGFFRRIENEQHLCRS